MVQLLVLLSAFFCTSETAMAAKWGFHSPVPSLSVHPQSSGKDMWSIPVQCWRLETATESDTDENDSFWYPLFQRKKHLQ